MAFKYYQPNKMDIKDKYGDCVIRAFCKAYNKTWLEAFRELIPYAEKLQMMPNATEVIKAYVEAHGGAWHGLRAEKGKRRMTVKELAKHCKGVHIANTAHHVVCIVDGDWYDTWDSGNKPIYGHWEL